ncbi:RDD family protein [Streptomyces sp. bgisy100]|uniref:RDD family protein n=1 Tax=Streptomyces sp. bgisy100 TaxID=3413783 RepID=UPI003D70DBC5
MSEHPPPHGGYGPPQPPQQPHGHPQPPYGYPQQPPGAPYGAPGPYGGPQQGPYGGPQQGPYGGAQQGPYGAPPPQPPYAGYYAPPGAPMGGPPQEALASQGVRLGARLLDGLILIVAFAVVLGVVVLLQLPGRDSDAYMITIAVLGICCWVALLFYEPVMTWKYGATLGKRICGIRVARLEDGQNISFGRAMGRWGITFAMGFVPLLPLLNVLWCCWDEPFRQCLHDKVVTTVVVKNPS